MKPIFTLTLAFASALLLLGACQKATDNGDLDGQWQVMKVTYHQTSIGDSVVSTKALRAYFAIQLDLGAIHGETLDLREPGASHVLFRFKETDGQLRLYSFHRHFREKDVPYTEEDWNILQPIGIVGDDITFKLDRLTSEFLQMSSPYATIEMRKFLAQK